MIAENVEELEKRLKEPFPAEDIEWRIQSSGDKNGKIWAKCLAYVTNRAIMERLDDVCGIAGWSNEFKEITDGGFLCGITIFIAGVNVTKWDGADKTAIEHTKGGISSAMKRTGAQWGIGRYLYNLDVGWADICEKGKFSAKTKDNKWFKWNPPSLPLWALPEEQNPPKASKELKIVTPNQKENPDDPIWKMLATAWSCITPEQGKKLMLDNGLPDKILQCSDAQTLYALINSFIDTKDEDINM